jgi:hypothetical protein
MSSDFYSSELLVRERISSKYQEAEADRLANTVSKDNRSRHSVLKSAGQALDRAIQVTLCKLLSTVRAISFAKRLSPCSESPAGYYR